jgi:hypothetical protein
VRAERDRTKKLIVAFHFLRTEQAGWKCDGCRRQGLEERRRCGFIAQERRGAKRLVWARGRVATEECPRSLVTPESIAFVELFFTWKQVGNGHWPDLSAREFDGFLAMEEELRAEVANGK